MKLFNTIVTTAVLTTTLLNHAPANAKPFIYMSSFSYSGDRQKCIKGAEAALAKHGFTNFEYGSDKESRSSSVSGLHKHEFITSQIECEQKLGVTTLGVSGIENPLTYEVYKKLHKEHW